jgi:hypothetical protein
MSEIRFDVSAWIRVWVSEEEITSDPRFEPIKNSDATGEVKIQELKDLAKDIAREKVGANDDPSSMEIDYDSLGTNSDKIDWYQLLQEDVDE